MTAVLDLAEILAGVTFLEIHAPPAARGALESCRGALTDLTRQVVLDALRERSIDDAELSIRSTHRLHARGIRSIRALETYLTSKTEVELRWGWKGELKTLKECRQLLETLGLAWKPKP